MAMTPEAKVKKLVTELLDKYGAYWFKPVSNGMGVHGIFDIICCLKGTFLGIECKADSTKKPTPLQTHNAERLTKAGGVAFLAHSDNIEELEVVINQIIERSNELNGLSVWSADSSKQGGKQ